MLIILASFASPVVYNNYDYSFNAKYNSYCRTQNFPYWLSSSVAVGCVYGTETPCENYETSAYCTAYPTTISAIPTVYWHTGWRTCCVACVYNSDCSADSTCVNGSCEITDNDKDGYTIDVDCNDNNSLVHPGADEICGNSIDENCDGIDEGCVMDNDADDDGYDAEPFGNDCNDNNSSIHPGANEICDGVDNNCNALVDEGDVCPIDNDTDDDGILDNEDNCPLTYNPLQEDLDSDGIGDVCDNDKDGDGYNANIDCNDNNALVHPNAVEICDNIDNNCNLQIDENNVCFIDNDNDGHFGFEDCNDNNNLVWQNLPGYVDNDLDGYGTGNLLEVCSGNFLLEGYSSINGDCNDNNATIHPGATEICGNSIDENCDGTDKKCSDGGGGSKGGSNTRRVSSEKGEDFTITSLPLIETEGEGSTIIALSNGKPADEKLKISASNISTSNYWLVFLIILGLLILILFILILFAASRR